MGTPVWSDIVTVVTDHVLASGATYNVDMDLVENRAAAAWLEVTVAWPAGADSADKITAALHASIDGVTFSTVADVASASTLEMEGAANTIAVGVATPVECWPAARAVISAADSDVDVLLSVRVRYGSDLTPVRTD